MGDFIAVRNLKTESTLSLMTSFAVKMPINDAAEKKYFVSTPRILKSLDSDVIEIDAPPSPFTVDKTPKNSNSRTEHYYVYGNAGKFGRIYHKCN